MVDRLPVTAHSVYGFRRDTAGFEHRQRSGGEIMTQSSIEGADAGQAGLVRMLHKMTQAGERGLSHWMRTSGMNLAAVVKTRQHGIDAVH